MTDKAAKKPATLRVYPVTLEDDTKRNIEAPSPHAAVMKVFQPKVGEPLTTQEVLALIRTQGTDAVELWDVATSATPNS